MDRSGRACVYEECSVTMARLVKSQHTQTVLGYMYSDGSGSNPSLALPQETHPDLFFVNTRHKVNPFRHRALRQPTIDIAVSMQALKIFGSFEKVQETATTYFNTIYQRMPIISKRRFYERLRPLSESTPADFSALYLCIDLILQYPLQQAQNMQSSLYLTVKSIISLLESTNHVSLEVVQCRLLVSFYEIGHGIFPAASISIGACARTARALGLNKNRVHSVDNEVRRIVAEEERRVWWAVVNLDR